MSRSAALRKGRYSEPERIYLITTTTEQRKPVFAGLAAGSEIARSLHFHCTSGWTENIAWVVMPDHVHWLFTLRARGNLGQLMRSFKSYTARILNERQRLKGNRLWQAGYHDHALRKEEDLRDVARYIITNPLRAGLVNRVGDYPFWDAAWL